MIEKKRPRRRKPRPNLKRSSNHIRAFNNNGRGIPRSRGAVSKALEKYTNMAQDAFSNGDRIVAENYYQYAEHYQRVLNEIAEDPQDLSSEKHPNSSTNNAHKPSRTQRATDAKSQKFGKDISEQQDLNSEDNSDKKSSEKTFTSDGIEALKPFEI